MKRILTLLAGVILLSAPMTMGQNYNVWITTEGSGISVSSDGYPYCANYPTHCNHYRHHNPHKCKYCKKQMREYKKAQKKYYKERQKAEKKKRRSHHNHKH